MAVTNASANFYNQVSELVADGTIDLDNDTFEILLTTVTHVPAAADSAIADIDNEVVGNGYARQTLTSITWNRTGNSTAFDFANPVFTASGGSITARNWHIRSVTADRLIAYGLLDNTPADVVTTDGNTLTVQINAAGLFNIAPA